MNGVSSIDTWCLEINVAFVRKPVTDSTMGEELLLSLPIHNRLINIMALNEIFLQNLINYNRNASKGYAIYLPAVN